MRKESLIVKGDPLATLKACGGYYKSPQDKEGKFLGPLVAYAGTYPTENGPKNYVGYEYFNFSRAESEATVRQYFAALIGEKIKSYAGCGLRGCDVFLGAPMGGILLATEIGSYLKCPTIFAEKKIIALADPEKGFKEESHQVIDRHEIKAGSNVVIVEDICNNFSTTEKLKTLIENHGGKLVAIVCAFNRSGKPSWHGIPVISALAVEAQQFKQVEPEVVELIKRSNIVWKPKFGWSSLAAAMESK